MTLPASSSMLNPAKTAAELQPPSEITSESSDRIQDALYGFTRSKLVFAAIDFDIFSKIAAGYNTLETIQSQLGCNARALRIFLDGLIGIGFLAKEPNYDGKPPSRIQYQLPPDIAHYLVKESPLYLGGMVKHCQRLSDNWGQLSDSIRTGLPAGGAQSLAHVEEYFSELVKGLYVSNFATAKKLAHLLNPDHTQSLGAILDVGGGSGVWSIALLESDHQAKATILDYPTVLPVAQDYVQRHALSQRFQYLGGDLEITPLPEKTYDMVLLANICHAIGPEATANLIQKVSGSLQPGGKIVVVDFVPSADRAEVGWPLIFAVNMLISTDEGDVFTEAQYQQWFQNAGIALTERFNLDSDVTALVGEKISDTKVYQFEI